MKTFGWRIAFVLPFIFAGMIFSSAAWALDPVPGEFIVRYRAAEGAAPASVQALHRRFGLRERRVLFKDAKRLRKSGGTGAGLSETELVRLDPNEDPQRVLAAYRADPGVELVEPNGRGTLAAVPSDPYYPQTSAYLSVIGAPGAWAVQAGAGAAVKVAVIDSGADPLHPDLAAALDLANSYNFVDHNTKIFDDIGHGTRVAGIIGAAGNNGEGIAGVAYGCRLMALDVTDSSGTITFARVIEALGWATAHGAGVVNMSLRFDGPSQALQDACDSAAAAGAVLVAAAGNENQGDAPVYPASYSSVLGVGAVMADGATRCPWSNYNGKVFKLADLVAPGANIFTTIPGGQYNGSYGSGTSFAARWSPGRRRCCGRIIPASPARRSGSRFWPRATRWALRSSRQGARERGGWTRRRR